MRSETACKKELELLLRDLKVWQAKLEKERDPVQRTIQGNTICALEGRIEALQWVLEGE